MSRRLLLFALAVGLVVAVVFVGRCAAGHRPRELLGTLASGDEERPGIESAELGSAAGDAVVEEGHERRPAPPGVGSEFVGTVQPKLAGEVTIRLAASTAVSLSPSQRAVVPREFLFGNRGSTRPAFLEEGRVHPVEESRWKMPIPQDDLVVVSVTVDGRRRPVVDGRTIARGSETHTVTVGEAETFRLGVFVDGELVAPDRLIVASEVKVPEDIEVRFRSLGKTVEAAFDVPPDNPSEKTMMRPGRAAERIHATSNPIAFDAAPFTRQLFVRTERTAWCRVEIPPGPGAHDVTLEGTARIVVRVSGAPRRSPPCRVWVSSIEPRKHGGAMWPEVYGDRELSIDDAPRTWMHLVVTRPGPLGEILWHERTFRVPPVETWVFDVDVSPPEEGELEIRIDDRSRLLTASDRVFVSAMERVRSAASGHELALSEFVEADDGSLRLTIPRAPIGRCLVALREFGMGTVVEIEAGRRSVARLEPSSIVRAVLSAPAFEGEDVEVRVARADRPSESLGAAAQGFFEAEARGDGVWSFRGQPGRYFVEVVDGGTRKVLSATIIELAEAPDTQRVALSDGAVGRLVVTVVDVAVVDTKKAVAGVVRSLHAQHAPARFVEVSQARWTGDDRRELHLEFAIAAGQSYALADNDLVVFDRAYVRADGAGAVATVEALLR